MDKMEGGKTAMGIAKFIFRLFLSNYTLSYTKLYINIIYYDTIVCK